MPPMAANRLVWVPSSDPEASGVAYDLAEVVSSADPKAVLVRMVVPAGASADDPCRQSAGRERSVPRAEVFEVNGRDQDGVADCTELMNLSEATMLHNLRARYNQDQIYTYTGTILIAVNPYKRLPIYGSAAMEQYKGKSIGTEEPHPFAIADDAWRSMRASGKSQAIIISGESGAGKTETAKVCMQYVSAVGCVPPLPSSPLRMMMMWRSTAGQNVGDILAQPL
jgi:myosin heavy subunit